MADAYREDLAYIHDAGFGHVAEAAGPVVLSALSRRGLVGGTVIDLGCGILSHAVATAGYDVFGIDIAPAMVALARRRVPRGRFVVDSLLTAELPPAVAVAAVGEGINYLFDRGNTQKSLARLFRRIHKSLVPQGIFLLDVAQPGRVAGAGVSRSYFEGTDWAVLVQHEEDRTQHRLTRTITTFRRIGTLYRRDQEVHCQRLLVGTELASQLRGMGFRVRLVRSYGSLRLGRGHIGLLASKV
jgi:SAM-dependent methyltransferase